jgi:hypothetical protein
MKQAFASTNLVRWAFSLLAVQLASARLVAFAPVVRSDNSAATVHEPTSKKVTRKLEAAAALHNASSAVDIKPLLNKAGHGMLRNTAGRNNSSGRALPPAHLLVAAGTARQRGGGRATDSSTVVAHAKDGKAEAAETHKKRMFYKEITFGAPWGFHELERDLRCDSHVKGTETGHVEWGATNTQAVQVLYFEPYGDEPTRAVLETYRKHLARTDLHICVSPECKVAVFYTTDEQKAAVGNFTNTNDHQPLLKCASLTSWKQAGIYDQSQLAPDCDTDKWAVSTYMNYTLQPETIALSDRCIT